MPPVVTATCVGRSGDATLLFVHSASFAGRAIAWGDGATHGELGPL